MEFDKGNVLSILSDNALDYKGWYGYFSDSVMALKQYVDKDDRSYSGNYDLLHEVYWDALDDMAFVGREVGAFCFFYPVEPPKEEWRSYKSLFEMARDVSGCSQVSDDMISVASFLIGKQLTVGNTIYAISAINYNLDTVFMCGLWFSMERLFQDGWKWIDAQESVARRCGVRETNQEK